MSIPPYASGATWSWPKEEPLAPVDNNPLPGAFVPEDHTPEEPEDSKFQEDEKLPKESAKPHKHYAPRTCRICLEVVMPTFETVDEGLTSMLRPAPKVQYISQEPESGRLIRPCKCKGSQRYVHEGCLQSWRHADPAYGRRNYFECPTCKFRYRLERMRWSSWISSTFTQIALTILILVTTVFLLGFVADPILNFYFDPVGTITTNPLSGYDDDIPPFDFDEEDSGWLEHILKGLASLGLLGFIKAFFAMGPMQWFNLRNSGILGGGGRNGRGASGRDRLENISWSLVLIGVLTFLWAVWKGVRAWSRRTLEKASERVVDVQGDDEDGLEDDTTPQPSAGGGPDSRKTQ